MADLTQQILRTDVTGMPLGWIDYRSAVRLHFLDQIAYSCGSVLFRLQGGINAHTRRRSGVEVNTIIATYGNNQSLTKARKKYTPSKQQRTLPTGQPYLSLLRLHVSTGAALAGSCAPYKSGRPRQLEQCSHRLRALQQPQGGKDTGAGWNGAAGNSVYSNPCRVYLPAGQKCPG